MAKLLWASSRRAGRTQSRFKKAAEDVPPPGAGGLSGRAGVHYLVFAGGLTEPEVKKAAEGAARAEFDLLELPLFDPDGVDVKMVREVLATHGLQASASLGLPFDLDISSEDPEVVARGEERLNQAVDVAAAFGSRHICGILYSAFGKYKTPPTQKGRANSIEVIRRLGQRGDSCGVQVNLEVVNRYETNLLNTAAQAVDFVDDVGHDNVRIHLDTYHMNIEEPSFAEAVKICGSRLGYVHLGESHRGYLGSGSVPWVEFFDALRAANYKGPVTFESFSNKVVAPFCVDALCVWRNLWEDSDDLARKARDFMDKKWADAV